MTIHVPVTFLNSNSHSYNSYTSLPFGILERQLLDSALGD